MTLLNRVKVLFFATLVGAAVVVGLRLFLGTFGFQYIIHAYLGAAAFTSAVTSLYASSLLTHLEEIISSRFS